MALAAAIEPSAIASWPAREQIAFEGWILRFSEGSSHRGNSAATLGTPLPGPALLARIEREYRARGLAALVQITPLSPAGLESVLADRGWCSVAPTRVMTAPVADATARNEDPGDARHVSVADEAFRRLVVGGSRNAADGEERLNVLARLEAPSAAIVAYAEGTAVACGVTVVTPPWAAIYVMRTEAAWRRQGHGRRVLRALARAARKNGAEGLYLQVEENNAPASALYAKAGFADGYAYRFLRAPSG